MILHVLTQRGKRECYFFEGIFGYSSWCSVFWRVKSERSVCFLMKHVEHPPQPSTPSTTHTPLSPSCLCLYSKSFWFFTISIYPDPKTKSHWSLFFQKQFHILLNLVMLCYASIPGRNSGQVMLSYLDAFFFSYEFTGTVAILPLYLFP